MSRTINTTINGTLSLLPTDNPLTITASGGVNATATGADAIDGNSSTAWAISNAGTISSASGYGVSLLGAGSSVTNYSGGSISGTGPTNISGVSITGGSGTVTNSGTISVSGGGYRVYLSGGATVTNSGGTVTNSGSITGGEDGVLIDVAAAGFGLRLSWRLQSRRRSATTSHAARTRRAAIRSSLTIRALWGVNCNGESATGSAGGPVRFNWFSFV